MQLTNSIALIISSATLIHGTTLSTFPNTGCLSNPANWFVTYYTWNDPSPYACMVFPVGASSGKWTLPANSRAYASDTSSCVQGPWNPVYGPRDAECFDYTKPSINSAWWVNSLAKAKRGPVSPTGDCIKPDVISYHNGTERVEAKIPEGQFDTVQAWADAKDISKLAGLEIV